ncbi:MAG: flavodoxin-dependent (E)-4-hydroxy-3-methylbut-2-enyl-diphosphate synthase [Actinomycetota bacterium]|nr:flavodoxin-dependent (E)-4-hydroxy-3-methylbut-2-enyl-diphosphate synthase [Actinomycetota bacterium]
MNITRKKTKQIKLGNLAIGGFSPIVVQSMTKSKLHQLRAIRKEIDLLTKGGCEVIRIAVPDINSLDYLKVLKQENIFKVPVVADIQFDYRLALGCLDLGIECIRINPGNIGGKERLAKVINKAIGKGAAIRIGVNSGSLEKSILRKNKGDIVDSMVESVLESVKFFERLHFYNFKISAKASSVLDTINVYEKISSKVDYPLHLGVTEAGPLLGGSIKSSLGLGILLSKGIGDTIRVSLTDSSLQEVKAAYLILNNLGLRSFGVDIISCPTCGRTRADLLSIVKEVEAITRGIKKPLKIAVMGCIVNGPGEAKDADLGVAFGKEKAAIFIKGKIKRRVEEKSVLDEFEKELQILLDR